MFSREFSSSQRDNTIVERVWCRCRNRHTHDDDLRRSYFRVVQRVRCVQFRFPYRIVFLPLIYINVLVYCWNWPFTRIPSKTWDVFTFVFFNLLAPFFTWKECSDDLSGSKIISCRYLIWHVLLMVFFFFLSLKSSTHPFWIYWRFLYLRSVHFMTKLRKINRVSLRTVIRMAFRFQIIIQFQQHRITRFTGIHVRSIGESSSSLFFSFRRCKHCFA